MNIFINDCKKENSYSIKENKAITIKKNLWKDICEDKEKICKLTFEIFLQNITDKDTFLDITVNQEKKESLRTILIVVFAVLGLIILIIIVFIVFRCIKKRKDDLKSKIEEIQSGKDAKLMD